jgi:pilus assembly protein Flp/PilA
MLNLIKLINAVRKDEEGTALIEYSILLGLIAVACIAAATAIGAWSSNQFTTLCANLPGTAGC